jgi:acylphosphatase
MEGKILYKIQVSGRVQGVGFRWSAVREAKKNGITGFVKNMSDGTVYIEAEGYGKQLRAYVEWCKAGPGFGNVESVTADPYPPVNYKDFHVEY